MTRYYIEDAKCGYDTCFGGCGPHTTVASAIKYKADNGEAGWMYCVQPEGMWPMIALYEEDVYEEIIGESFLKALIMKPIVLKALAGILKMRIMAFMNCFIRIRIMVPPI